MTSYTLSKTGAQIEAALTITDYISNLTDAEGTQLENIDATTISSAQWAYLGALDQGLSTTNSPTFSDVTVSNGTAQINNSATNEYAFEVISTGNVTSIVNAISRFDCRGTGSTKPVVQIDNDGTGNALDIDQNGNGVALNIDSEATNAEGVKIDVGISNAQAGLNVLQDVNSFSLFQYGRNQSIGTNWIYRNLTATSTVGAVMYIEQDHATDDQNALTIQQDGIGVGLFIDQNGNGTGLNVDHEGTSTNAVQITTTATTGRGLYVYNNGIQTGNQLVYFEQNNASSTVPAETIVNNGTGNGVFIDQNGNGIPLYIDNDGTSAPIRIDAGTNGTATSATAGANGDVPSQVVGYLVVNIDGTNRKIPYYAI